MAARSVFLMRRMAKPFRYLGSAVMRGDQLAALIAPFLDDNLTVRAVPFHAGLMPPRAVAALAGMLPRDAIVIFVKSAARGLTEAHLEPLRRRGAKIGFDSIDTAIHDIDLDLFDFQIAASVTAKTVLEDELATLGRTTVPVELLHHHHDPRLTPDDTEKPFRCGYVGERKNALLSPALAAEVTLVDVNHEREFAKAIPQIRQFTLHYGVRPMSQIGPARERAIKPFTKGFTAAACGANILVNAEADDAIALLGADYPYLVSSSEPEDILRQLTQARETFGTPVWTDALDRMRALKELVAPAALATRMSEIIERVSD